MGMSEQDLVRTLFDYDPQTGVCTWKEDRVNAKQGEPIDNRYRHGNYIILSFRGRPYSLGRLIYLWMEGHLPNRHEVVRYKNGDKNDNRWSNLEKVDRRGVSLNRALQQDMRSVPESEGEITNLPNGTFRVELNGVFVGVYSTRAKAEESLLQAKVLFG